MSARRPPVHRRPGQGAILTVLSLVGLLATPHPARAWGGCACDPDVVLPPNGIVDDGDLLEIQACFGGEPINSCIRADVDCDGDIDNEDVEAWGRMAGGGDSDLCCPFLVNLEQFPFILAESPANGEMTGAAVLQATLNWLHWDANQYPTPPLTFADQTWLYDYAHAGNADPNLDDIDTQGMLETLQALRPRPFAQYGYSFRVVHGTDSDAVLKQIAQWVAYENGTYGGHMEGHPYHVLAIIPARGDYSHWMAVRGIRTNEPAYPLPANLILWGLYLNDPHPGQWPDVLGEFQYVEAENFIRTYYLPLVTNDTYNGEYVAIVGMPNQADIPAVSEWGLIVMTLLMLTSGTLVYQRRVPAPSAWKLVRGTLRARE